MQRRSRGLLVGGHDDHFLIIDRVGTDYVVGVRSHNGELLSVYLRSDDITEVMKFLTQAPNQS
jgi:hypothetical protein